MWLNYVYGHAFIEFADIKHGVDLAFIYLHPPPPGGALLNG